MATELIGKEDVLSSLAVFLEALERGPRGFVVEGEAGIGKTTVWQAGLREAEPRAAGSSPAGRPAPKPASRSLLSGISSSGS